jgi:hypothetical protein
MGLFSSIIGGVTSLISGGKNRRNDARNRASAEKLAELNRKNAQMAMRNEQAQRAHELAMLQAAPKIKNNKPSFIPWVIGGVSGLGAILAIVLNIKSKPTRR